MQLQPLEELATRAIQCIIITEIVEIITMGAMLNRAVITITQAATVITTTIPRIQMDKHRLSPKSPLVSMKSKS